MSTPTMRLFAMLVWTPRLGAPLTPVGALAVAADNAAEHQASFIPRLNGIDEPWRSRLETEIDGQALAGWLTEASTCALTELDVPDGAVDLAGAAEAGLDHLLAEVWPALLDAGAA